MTEADWLAATDPEPMLRYLKTKGVHRSEGGRRRLRLFGCCCARRVWRLMRKRGRQWVELGERLADASLTEGQRRLVDSAAMRSTKLGKTADLSDSAALFTLESRVMMASEMAAGYADMTVGMEAYDRGMDERAAKVAEQEAQAGLLRDIFTPFRPAPAAKPAWLIWQGGAVAKLARLAFDERQLPEGTLDPARLALVADALEDAGCADAELLGHLKGPGPHVRGCWALDLVLGKE
jgi:hypothetical protein